MSSSLFRLFESMFLSGKFNEIRIQLSIRNRSYFNNPSVIENPSIIKIISII